MDHVSGLEPVPLRDLGGAGFAAAEGTAFGQQIRTRSAMNGAIHAAAAEQRAIGGIYDCIDIQCRDVGNDNVEDGLADFGRERCHTRKHITRWQVRSWS